MNANGLDDGDDLEKSEISGISLYSMYEMNKWRFRYSEFYPTHNS